jgi:hypothetical protein
VKNESKTRLFRDALMAIVLAATLGGCVIAPYSQIGPSAAKSDREPPEQEARFQAIQALNYVLVSLVNIEEYNDRIVLEQEYSTIRNNLKLRSIPDERIVLLLGELMDVLTKSKITDTEREFIERRYVRNVNSALKDSIVSGASGMQFSANPYMTLASALMNTGTVYFNYRGKVEQYKEDKKEQSWEIDKQRMITLNDFSRQLMELSWGLLDDFDLPDRWQLVPDDLESYMNALKDGDEKRRHRKLCRLEKKFEMYPPYWYYRGKTAQDLGDREDALHCFDLFWRTRKPIHRQDQFAASVAMCQILLHNGKRPSERTLKDLERLVENSTDKDWTNLLFAALQYARLGRMKQARDLVMRNLDNGYTESMMATELGGVLLPAVLSEANPEQFDRVMTGLLESDTTKNYDVLRLYGKMQNRDVLRRISPEFREMLLVPGRNKSMKPWVRLLKDDDLHLCVPSRWIADNLSSEVELNVTGEEEPLGRGNGIAGDSANKSYIVFGGVVDIDEIIDSGTPLEVSIKLARERLFRDKTSQANYDVVLQFVSEVVSREDARKWWAKVAKAWVMPLDVHTYGPLVWWLIDDPNSDKGLVFRKKAVVINGEKFEWTDTGLVVP